MLKVKSNLRDLTQESPISSQNRTWIKYSWQSVEKVSFLEMFLSQLSTLKKIPWTINLFCIITPYIISNSSLAPSHLTRARQKRHNTCFKCLVLGLWQILCQERRVDFFRRNLRHRHVHLAITFKRTVLIALCYIRTLLHQFHRWESADSNSSSYHTDISKDSVIIK